MHEYRQVINAMRLGHSDRLIAHKLKLVSRTKAKEIRAVAITQGWLSLENSLPDEATLVVFFKTAPKRASTESLALPYAEEIKRWVNEGIQASTIHQALVRKYQFSGSYDSIQRFVYRIKDKKISASTVLDFSPGESAQVDFGAGPLITDVVTGQAFKTWIFVMVLSWSRHLYAEIVLDQAVETWLGCHRRAFEFFNGVPGKIIIDNAKCAITRAWYYDPEVQRSYRECAEGYGFVISACPPREPKKKGRVESGVKYVKNNFVPLREFRSFVDANAQLRDWILSIAGNRTHGSTCEKPLTRFEEVEKHVLKTLPTEVVELSSWKKVKVHGDCHVQFEKCYYSVSHTLVSQSLWLRATESCIRVYQEYACIATHPRLRKAGQRHTLNDHLPPEGLAFKMRDPQWCLDQAKQIGKSCHHVLSQLFQDKVLDQLRAAQGIISLKKTYGAARLEAACQRALAFNAINYRSVKNILKQGAEYQPLPAEVAFDALAETYTGKGIYSRTTSTILQ